MLAATLSRPAPVLDLLDRLQSALEARYTIEREIGHGGMAVVYRANDLRHDRIVALKVFQPRVSEKLGTERFLREIKVAARLQHPHLLPLYDSGEAGGFLYYVTPYVEGGSLRDMLDREGRLSPTQALRLAREVADALDYAHRQQVVHRDVKPENILLEEGHAIVADFGVARAVSVAAETGLTQPGLLVGTSAYMSPEQADDTALDGRSDIYSLGSVLFELLAGRPPFMATSPLAFLALRLSEPAPSLASAGVHMPAAVEHLIARTLARLPADRFQSAAELARALAEAERQLVQGTAGGRDSSPVPRSAAMAVLPFVNVSADPENEYFSDGMTEELITALGRVEGLRVVSRASAFTFKGRGVDVREVGQRLNVGTVLEGSVRRSGDRLRVTAQLVDASDGYQLWADSYERPMADVFALQEELTQAIVASLPLPVAGVRPKALVRPSTSATEAYTLYLRGRYYALKRSVAGLTVGIEHFEKALERDPGYALAHAGLAECWALRGFEEFGDLRPIEAMPRAKTAAIRALELDPGLAEAHCWSAVVTFLFDWDWDAAEASLQRAIELRPDYSLAHTWYAVFLMTRGRHDESIARSEHAAELDPLALTIQTVLGTCLYYARRFDEALARHRSTLELEPGNLRAQLWTARCYRVTGQLEPALHTIEQAIERCGRAPVLLAELGTTLGLLGQRADALAVLDELEDLRRGRYIASFFDAGVHSALGATEEAIRCFERMEEERSGIIPFLATDPGWDALRRENWFQRLLARHGVT